MPTNRMRKSPMITTAEITDLTRSRAHELVARAERATGSRMAAYYEVAKLAGTSADWMRKFIKGYEAKEPKATVFENIRVSYEAFCNRVEQENRTDELRLHSLRRGPNARHQGTSEKTET